MGTGVAELDQAITRTIDWLKEIEYMLSPCDRQQAYLAWRAVILPLRDKMEAHAVVQLAEHLPLPLRGALWDGWRIAAAPPSGTSEEFIQAVADRLPGRFPWEPEVVIRAVFEGLVESVAPEAVADILERTPASLRPYWPKHL